MSSSWGFNPRGKRAIITGGAQGIGYELASKLLSAGAKVCICDIDLQRGKKSAEELKAMYPEGRDR